MLDVQSYLTRPEAYDLQTKLFSRAITLVKNSPKLSFNEETICKSCIIQIGRMPEDAFVILCKKYSNNVANYGVDLSEQELQSCLESAKKSDIVILGIGQMNKFAQKQFGVADTSYKLISLLHEMNKKVVVVLFGTPYSIPYFGNADVIIEAYEDAIPAQRASFELLCGSLIPQGKLPVTL